METPACPDAAAAPALAANWGVLSPEEARTAVVLLAAGQAHLFADWPAPGERDDDKKRLLVQARGVAETLLLRAATKPWGARERERTARRGAVASPRDDDVLRVVHIACAPPCRARCRDATCRALNALATHSP
jgi:hypothetical protein